MDWLPIAVAGIGSVGGGYLGVRLAVVALQIEMKAVQEEIKSLRADRHKHANMIQDHEARLSFLERDRK